jgi:hypothetical protein
MNMDTLSSEFLSEYHRHMQRGTEHHNMWLERMLMFLTNPTGDKTLEERHLRLQAAIDIVGDTFND